MSKCNCSMSISVLGDGCQFCQPQTHIDLMREDYDALLAERDELLGALEGLEAAHCDTSPYLTKAQLSFGRKSLMAARAAIAKARGDV